MCAAVNTGEPRTLLKDTARGLLPPATTSALGCVAFSHHVTPLAAVPPQTRRAWASGFLGPLVAPHIGSVEALVPSSETEGRSGVRRLVALTSAFLGLKLQREV